MTISRQIFLGSFAIGLTVSVSTAALAQYVYKPEKPSVEVDMSILQAEPPPPVVSTPLTPPAAMSAEPQIKLRPPVVTPPPAAAEAQTAPIPAQRHIQPPAQTRLLKPLFAAPVTPPPVRQQAQPPVRQETMPPVQARPATPAVAAPVARTVPPAPVARTAPAPVPVQPGARAPITAVNTEPLTPPPAIQKAPAAAEIESVKTPVTAVAPTTAPIAATTSEIIWSPPPPVTAAPKAIPPAPIAQPAAVPPTAAAAPVMPEHFAQPAIQDKQKPPTRKLRDIRARKPAEPSRTATKPQPSQERSFVVKHTPQRKPDIAAEQRKAEIAAEQRKIEAAAEQRVAETPVEKPVTPPPAPKEAPVVLPATPQEISNADMADLLTGEELPAIDVTEQIISAKPSEQITPVEPAPAAIPQVETPIAVAEQTPPPSAAGAEIPASAPVMPVRAPIQHLKSAPDNDPEKLAAAMERVPVQVAEAPPFPPPYMQQEVTEPVTAAPATPDAIVVPTINDLSLPFEGNAATLSPETEEKLKNIMPLLKEHKEKRLQIRAYASGEDGSKASARRISLSRALLVRSFLMDNGIKPAQVDVRALGTETERKPVDRVDIVFAR